MQISGVGQSRDQTDDLSQVVLIVPTYQPSDAFSTLIPALRSAGFARIVVVNDGSAAETHWRFEEAAQQSAVVLEHPRNRGKGAALKTGFQVVLDHFPATAGVVTCDADGQHLVPDIVSVARAFLHDPSTVVLGSRTFDSAVPFRNRFGNSITKWIFRLIVGGNLSDTQTGLRAIPQSLLPSLIELKTSNYDFELEMLICALQSAVPLAPVPITTVYRRNQEPTQASRVLSHFHPLRDSLRIYSVFARFILSSVSRFVARRLSIFARSPELRSTLSCSAKPDNA